MGAAREVVLAAGAIGSPALLMRSGIGHGDELARHGIAVAHHLPGVGQNLHDHISAGVQFQSPSSLTYGISLRVAPRLAWNAMEYLLFRQGQFASNLIEGGGFVRTLPGLTRPDIQYTFLPGHRNPTRTLGLGHGYALTTILLRPKSRGRLTLASSAPDAMPVIDPRFFDDPDDMETLLRGVKFGRTILDAPAFAPFRGRELKPGADIQTDDALRDYIREFAATIFHPVGTCRMGADADAVVDPELRVDGIAGLRVADASIMPTIVGGNTNAPVIMIAEKAADMILNR
jgi:choline dehydrogenase-like flavoprotein